jgi:hypothetical protein
MRGKVPRKHSNGTELRGRRAEGIFWDTTLPPGLAGRRDAADHFTEARNMKRAWHEARESVVDLFSHFNGAAARRRRVLKSLWSKSLLVFAVGVLGAAPALSQTQVNSITASPGCVDRT